MKCLFSFWFLFELVIMLNCIMICVCYDKILRKCNNFMILGLGVVIKLIINFYFICIFILIFFVIVYNLYLFKYKYCDFILLNIY